MSPLLSTPDLRFLFYGGGLDAERAFLLSAYNSGITAAKLLQMYTGTTYMRKTNSQGFSDANLANVTDLSFAIAASEVWFFSWTLIYDGTTAIDLQLAVTVPSGATLNWGGAPIAQVGATTDVSQVKLAVQTVSGTKISFGAGGAGTKMLAVVRGMVVNGSTDGTVQLQAAQDTAGGTNTNIFANSFGEARRAA